MSRRRSAGAYMDGRSSGPFLTNPRSHFNKNVNLGWRYKKTELTKMRIEDGREEVDCCMGSHWDQSQGPPKVAYGYSSQHPKSGSKNTV